MPTTSTETAPHLPIQTHHNQALPALILGAMGVVFGDIGTSPLYAFREAFSGVHAATPTPANVLGILSMMLWALILVVSLKYVVFIRRANNKGEGGIMALIALIQRAFAQGLVLREGVYAGLLGPRYETPAEVRLLRLMGHVRRIAAPHFRSVTSE